MLLSVTVLTAERLSARIMIANYNLAFSTSGLGLGPRDALSVTLLSMRMCSPVHVPAART